MAEETERAQFEVKFGHEPDRQGINGLNRYRNWSLKLEGWLARAKSVKRYSCPLCGEEYAIGIACDLCNVAGEGPSEHVHVWKTISVQNGWFTECETCKIGAPLSLQAEFAKGEGPSAGTPEPEAIKLLRRGILAMTGRSRIGWADDVRSFLSGAGADAPTCTVCGTRMVAFDTNGAALGLNPDPRTITSYKCLSCGSTPAPTGGADTPTGPLGDPVCVLCQHVRSGHTKEAPYLCNAVAYCDCPGFEPVHSVLPDTECPRDKVKKSGAPATAKEKE